MRPALLLLVLAAGASCQQNATNSSAGPPVSNIVVSSVQVSTAPIVIRKPQKLPGQDNNRRQRQLGFGEFYNYGLQDSYYEPTNFGQYSVVGQPTFDFSQVNVPKSYGFSENIPAKSSYGFLPSTPPNRFTPIPEPAKPIVFSPEHPAHGHALRQELETPAQLGFTYQPGNFMQSLARFIGSLSGQSPVPATPARAQVSTGTGPANVGLFAPSSFGFSAPSAPSGPGRTKTGVTLAGQQQQCVPREPLCDPKSPYRTIDGSCNNLRQPRWGMAGSPFTRLLPPRYADGVQAPLDEGLPLPRVLSYTLFPDLELADPSWTLAAMQWAQFVTHDMSMAAGSRQHKPHAIRCCAQDGHDVVNDLAQQSGCFPIRIPAQDPFYSLHNQRCMDFVRSSNDVATGCSNGPAQQMTAVTSYLDLSLVYGSSADTLRGLREFRGGRLIVARRKGDEWLPESTNRTADCETADDEEPCYRSGDVRVNQNPGQAVLQTLFLREHNRIATVLSTLNRHWDDEVLFQEARRINVAQTQHITYYEWLPILIGVQEVERRGLVQLDEDFSSDYDENTDATAINDHATGAFRHLHTLIPSQLVQFDAKRNGLQALRLSDVFNRPAVIEAGRSLDQFVRGLATQPEHAPDHFFSAEITQFLFRAGKPFGGDLRSIDIQRGRDHGLPGYNAYRELCGLPKATSFHDFADVMDHEATESLASLYGHVDDVDMLVGGGLERNTPGALAGPTFVCIMAEQFRRARQGDRFWFELGQQPGSFTPGQLQELRKSSLSRIMCDNAKGVQAMQLRAFQQIGFRNPLLPCSEVPAIDLTFWDAHDPSDLPTAPQ